MDMTVGNDYGASTGRTGSLTAGGTRTWEMSAKRMYSTRAKKNKKRKKLNYNSREISVQLMRVSHSRGVSQVLASARARVAYLSRCASSGNYDEKEVRAALAHAKRMVKCASKKLHNMEKEELLKSRGNKKSITRSMEEENRIRELYRRELEKLRRRHRGEEYGEIKDADMRYLKEKIRQEQRSASYEYSGAEEMSAAEVPVDVAVDMGAVDMGCEIASTVDVML